jgi:hypothetical protein
MGLLDWAKQITSRKIRLSNIIPISTGTPIEFRALSEKSKATSARNTVAEVGARMAALDQQDGVDLSGKKGEVDVSNAKLPSQGGLGGLISAVVPEKVTGFANYGEDGQLQSLYTASEDISGKKELQYQRNQDGSQTYAVTTSTGQTTVRESRDGTLFMIDSPQADAQDWNTMTSPDFKAPEQKPEERPRTTDDAKRDWNAGVKKRSGLLSGLLNADTRDESLSGLKDELLGGWNPFKKRS